MELGSEADDAKDALDGHVELIRRIKSAYGEAAEGLREYASESDKLLRQDIVDRIKAYRDTILDTAKSLRSGVLDLPASTFGGATFTIQQLQSAIAQLDKGIKSGSPDLQAFIGRLIDIENQSGTPEQVKKLIKEIRESATAGIEAQRGLEPLVGVIEGIGAAAAGQVSRVGALAKALESLNGFSLPKLSDLEEAVSLRDKALASEAGATEAGVREIENAYRKALERIDAQNPTVANIDGHQANVPTPESKPSTLGDEPAKVSSEVRGAANAYRDLLKSADDRIAQMRLEAELSGQSDPSGSIIGASNVSVRAVSADRNVGRFQGLPANYRLTVGDKVQLTQGTLRTFHEVSETINATAGGLIDVLVHPWLPLTLAIGAVITLVRPACPVIVAPNSHKAGVSRRSVTEGAAFRVLQKRRA